MTHLWLGLLAALAAWPLLTRASLFTSTDADLHIYRIHQLLTVWQTTGLSVVRWAPDLAFGLGYPVFNYYAPLSHYLGAAFGRVCCDLETGPVLGVKFVLLLSTVLGVWGMYGAGRALWGERGGGLSAGAFALSPYVIYLNPLARGAVPEALALALAPWMLWATVRLHHAPSLRNVALTGLASALLVLAHNLISGVMLGLIGGWYVIATPPKRWGGLVGALVLGAGLSAIFWLPALLERDVVQYQRAFADVSQPNAALQWVNLATLFGWSTSADVADPRLVGWQMRAGIMQLGLAGVALVSAFFSRPRSFQRLFWPLASLVLLCLITPYSASIWHATPLTFLQLPWRLLGPLALTLSVGGGGVAVGERAKIFLPLTLAGLCVLAFPLLSPLPWADYGPITLPRLREFEAGGYVGTTAQNEFLPSTAREFGPLEITEKFDSTSLPAGSELTLESLEPLVMRAALTTPTAFTLRLFTLAFPGWVAYVDEQPVPITPSVPEGLITVSIPAGTHRVRFQFETTPPRQWGMALSLLALALTSGALVLGRGREVNDAPHQGDQMTLSETAMLSAILGVTLLARFAVDHLPVANSVSHEPVARFEGNLVLVQTEFPPTVAVGSGFPLTLTWQATGPAPRDLSVFVHVVGLDGKIWAQSDKPQPVTDWPTDRWPVGRALVDDHWLTLHADTPPGHYTVRVGLWDRITGQQLPLRGMSDTWTTLEAQLDVH